MFGGWLAASAASLRQALEESRQRQRMAPQPEVARAWQELVWAWWSGVLGKPPGH
jgi:hypothetical protein